MGIRGQASEYTQTSRGRKVKKVNYKETANRGRRDTANATVETHESKYHKQRPKTKAQRANFLEKMHQARRNNKPMVFRDISGHPEERTYRRAVEAEFEHLQDRMVFELVSRESVPQGVEVGDGIVLVSVKRDGTYKARCVYNGSKQRYKIVPSSSSPTLDEDSLTIALAIAAIRGWDFRTADITTAFLNAPLPEGTQIYMEIPDGHPEHGRRKEWVLRIKQNIYGIKEAAAIWWKHFCGSILRHTGLKQSIYDYCVYFNS